MEHNSRNYNKLTIRFVDDPIRSDPIRCGAGGGLARSLRYNHRFAVRFSRRLFRVRPRTLETLPGFDRGLVADAAIKSKQWGLGGRERGFEPSVSGEVPKQANVPGSKSGDPLGRDRRFESLFLRQRVYLTGAVHG